MSSIKGGGRATLSDANEEALVNLLMRRRNCWPKDSTDHDLKRERRRFVKNLLESHERSRLNNKLNYSVGLDEESSKPIAVAASKSSLVVPSSASGKVKVELVEAIYPIKTKDDKKSSSKKSKLPFKEGTRKVLALPRSTSFLDLLKQGQNKLRIKKAVRVFAFESGQIIDLVSDLSGVSDGTILYITSQSAEVIAADSDKTREIAKQASEEPIPDPLTAVKQAYQQRARRQRGHNRESQSGAPTPHPIFANHLDKLPPLSDARSQLPAAHCRHQVLHAMDKHRVLIISGATGCGKSTQIPQFLWEGMKAAGLAASANIVVTQPRRVAATALAQRVAKELDSPVPGKRGSLVGHHVRFDRAVADSAKILYCTVGILLRRLLYPNETDDSDSNTDTSAIPLSDITHVVVDEVHERDVNTDFCLALLRSALKRHVHLRVILMSATASAKLFVDYFGEQLDEPPLSIAISGRSFPVEVKWLDECQPFASSRINDFREKLEEKDTGLKSDSKADASSIVAFSPRARDKIDNVFMRNLIASIIAQQQRNGELEMPRSSDLHREDGALLVFLPGKAEIESLHGLLTSKDRGLPDKHMIEIYKLHSEVPRGLQQSVFQPASAGTVKIILATNLAETSITISDVSHVIDCGRVKESRFNSATRTKELVTVWISKASAKQREGRAGRTSAGVCYKLYSEAFCESYMPTQTCPEILRLPLDELLMKVCLLYEQRRDEQPPSHLHRFPRGVNPFKILSILPQSPPDSSMEEACKHLLEVDALHLVQADPVKLYRLTPLGFHLSRLPMDAKVGKVLIVGCVLECLDSALTIAATLSCSKSCFAQKGGGYAWRDTEFEAAVEARSRVIECGFGGKTWKGGTVKGDLIATIAIYREWTLRNNYKEQAAFARLHALDQVGLREISALRKQYFDLLVDAGFVLIGRDLQDHAGFQNQFQDDALLASCCLVAGLYPNICTLVRPQERGRKSGRLLTKNGDACIPQPRSFQTKRVHKASATGKDAYAVYHNKLQSMGTGHRPGDVLLSEVNFVSRYALLLFCGELEVVNNAIIIDGWLKFKIGDKSTAGAVVLLALREELDKSLIQQIVNGSTERGDPNVEELMAVVRQLIASEC